MRELGDRIPGLRRPYHQLARHSPATGVKRQGLFGGEAPLRSETLSEVDRAELPIGGVPSRTLTSRIIRAAGNEPALDNLSEKALSEQPLPVCAR